MKKLLAITLAFVLVLSLSTVSFAAGSPVKTVTAKDLPEESDVVKEAAVTSGTAEVVALKDMTAAQKAEANKAISANKATKISPIKDVLFLQIRFKIRSFILTPDGYAGQQPYIKCPTVNYPAQTTPLPLRKTLKYRQYLIVGRQLHQNAQCRDNQKSFPQLLSRTVNG